MSPILPNLMPRDTESLKNFLFDELLGRYKCRVENVFGGDEAETVVSECGKLECTKGAGYHLTMLYLDTGCHALLTRVV